MMNENRWGKTRDDSLIAHLRKKDREAKDPQYLWQHLENVSELAGRFAGKIGLGENGKILGLLHDLGKASRKFQDYIRSNEGIIDPDADAYIDPKAQKGKIDHSTAGAQVIFEALSGSSWKEQIAAQILALCIASHHSGLIDCFAPDGEDNFRRRIEKPDPDTHKTEAVSRLPEIMTKLERLLSEPVSEQLFLKLKNLKEEGEVDTQETLAFKTGLLVRFLFSCLIDADRLDTADFENPGNTWFRNYGRYHPWEILVQRLEAKVQEFDEKEERTFVDDIRREVSQACLDFASKPKGIYQLTVPTGGGKTLASLRFALHHAAQHCNSGNPIDRIFYIIPYTTIIDQNAEEIRNILEDRDRDGKFLDRVVLEHHSNLTPEEETRRQSLLAENWDAPVVFTTQVQFLEALFGGGTRNARRMHQLANSVIIIDEVQTIPIQMVHMLNIALRFLVKSCGATVVLCTATQPPLDKLDAAYRSLTIHSNQKIIKDEHSLYTRLRRVEVIDRRKIGGWSYAEAAELVEEGLQKKGSVLIVVNTKRSARSLYEAIAARNIEGAQLFHLSTSMCPAHRLETLNKIKALLENSEPVICVSTQLIEAGVDIDFGAVIRYLAGLDSIAQSAGRCYRHGKRPGLGIVWVINPEEENIDPLKEILVGREQAERVLSDFQQNPEAFNRDLIGLKAMEAYFRFYFAARKDEMDYKVGAGSTAGRADNLVNLLSINTISVNRYIEATGSKPTVFCTQSFQTAGKEFKVICSPTTGVIVPYKEEGEELIKDLCGAFELEHQYKLLKKAQKYSVNLYQHDFSALAKKGAIQEVQEGTGIFYLDGRYYHEEFGWSSEIVSDMDLLLC